MNGKNEIVTQLNHPGTGGVESIASEEIARPVFHMMMTSQPMPRPGVKVGRATSKLFLKIPSVSIDVGICLTMSRASSAGTGIELVTMARKHWPIVASANIGNLSSRFLEVTN